MRAAGLASRRDNPAMASYAEPRIISACSPATHELGVNVSRSEAGNAVSLGAPDGCYLVGR